MKFVRNIPVFVCWVFMSYLAMTSVTFLIMVAAMFLFAAPLRRYIVDDLNLETPVPLSTLSKYSQVMTMTALSISKAVTYGNVPVEGKRILNLVQRNKS